MGQRRKKRIPDPTREELLTQEVSNLLSSEAITPRMIYDLLLMGYRCYKPGLGLDHETVWCSILEGFGAHDRVYLSPGQMARLHNRNEPTDEDFEHLAV